jgi:CRISPR-associated endonuclease/helicase Cas3
VTLGLEDFPTFFAAANGGHAPFQWQRRLAEKLVTTGEWPERMVAPTGAGKTSAIDVHVFAVAVAIHSGSAIRPPRRLAMVVDRRALVNDQYDRALRLAEQLQAPQEEVVVQVSKALKSLRYEAMVDKEGDRNDPNVKSEEPPLLVARLRGGQPPPRQWRDDPTACAVVCATPDMWGSRLLFRGYGTSRRARPVEAGLLMWDTAVVLDEAHLNRQLLFTARRVSSLASPAAPHVGPPPLAVVETSATPGTDEGTEVGVETADLEVDEALRRRMTTPKPVRTIELEDGPGGKPAAARVVAKRLADEASQLHQRFGSPVGCFVNTVAMALAVTRLLRERGQVVEVVCGRLRPHDLERLRTRRPGLLSVAGEKVTGGVGPVEILVATQSLEVGVDLDLVAAVTELAPAPALAQRAGRVNRLGERDSTEVVVAGPKTRPKDDAPPYRADELGTALDWIRGRSVDPRGLAPESLASYPPPARETRPLNRFEAWDAWHLDRTSHPQAAEPDLEIWLSDDLEPDLDLGVVVRGDLTGDAARDRVALATVGPRPEEVVPVRISLARKLVKRLVDRGAPGMMIDRGGIEALASAELRPGATLVLAAAEPLAEEGVITELGKEQLLDVADDVAHAAGRVDLRLSPEAPIAVALGADGLRAALTEATALDRPDPRRRPGLQGRAGRTELGRLLAELARAVSEATARDRLNATASVLRNGRLAHLEVALINDGEPGDGNAEGAPLALYIGDRRRRVDDDAVQVTSPSKNAEVPLDQHRRAVASRTLALAIAVNLSAEETRAVELAGWFHDDGKSDPRFQVGLGRPPDESIIRAKSTGMTKAAIDAAWSASGLPSGWRHEQLSAAIAWQALSGESPFVRQVATRLVGTSHGLGRPWFSHGPDELVPEADPEWPAVTELFEDGQWEELVERLSVGCGPQRMAYLEALVRAADHQVSQEGG